MFSRDGVLLMPGRVRTGERRGRTRQAIEHHYDVGREFLPAVVGRPHGVSCALWPGDLDDDLEAAQLAKLDWHATGARADGAGRVLDVGCGWGAMMRYLSRGTRSAMSPG